MPPGKEYLPLVLIFMAMISTGYVLFPGFLLIKYLVRMQSIAALKAVKKPSIVCKSLLIMYLSRDVSKMIKTAIKVIIGRRKA